MARFYGTAALSAVGLLTGAGLGIYAAVENFNPDQHQSEDMTESMRVFNEVIQQTIWVAGYTGLFTSAGSIIGSMIDCCLFCCFCCCGDGEELRSLLSA